MFFFPALTVSHIQAAAKIQPFALFIGRQIEHLRRGADEALELEEEDPRTDNKKTEAAPSALPDPSTFERLLPGPIIHTQGVQRQALLAVVIHDIRMKSRMIIPYAIFD